MSEKTSKNIGASVRQRLLNISRDQNIDYGVMLSNYALERFLYRLSCSEYKDKFILKGAMLFRIWSSEPHRATRDMDLLASGDPVASEIESLFRDICSVRVEDDGVNYETESIRIDYIREEQEYGGMRVRLLASIAGARVPLQIDIGFGDAAIPTAEKTEYPTILNFPAPMIRTYTRETVIAEKFHAMVTLGIANSRMKDFYDIYSLAMSYQFDSNSLCSAIRSTFERRSTAVPDVAPIALTAEFSRDSLKVSQWRAFISGGNVMQTALTLQEAVEVISSFLLPAISAVSQKRQHDGTWVPPGHWIK
jgi:predicted nucleotidyltransferase component of viral defense system